MNSKSTLSAGTHFLTLLGLGTQVDYFLKRRPVSVGQSSGVAAPDLQ